MKLIIRNTVFSRLFTMKIFRIGMEAEGAGSNEDADADIDAIDEAAEPLACGPPGEGKGDQYGHEYQLQKVAGEEQEDAADGGAQDLKMLGPRTRFSITW